MKKINKELFEELQIRDQSLPQKKSEDRLHGMVDITENTFDGGVAYSAEDSMLDGITNKSREA